MHFYFQYIATEIARERLLEARTWRLATEARRGETRPGLVERVLARLGGRAQPARTATPTFSPDSREVA